jgi:hypothetical protein
VKPRIAAAGAAAVVTILALCIGASLLHVPSFDPGPDPSLRAREICSKRFPWPMRHSSLAYLACFHANGGNGSFFFMSFRPREPLRPTAPSPKPTGR